MHVNLSLRQQPFIILISWPSPWLHSIFSDSLQLWYRCLTEQKGRIEKIRNHRKVMHDFPQSLYDSSPVTSLATSAASSFFQPGDCYLFTRSRDYQFLCVFSSAAPSLLLSACFAFCLLLCVFFICTCACSIFSYLMLPRHLDSSTTPGSCDTVAIAMCLHVATQKGQNSKCSNQDFKNNKKQGLQH